MLLVVAVACIGAFAGAGWLWANYPFPLDDLEHEPLQQVERIRAGLRIYVAPTPGHVPSVGGVVYVYLAALVAWVSGSDLFALRAMSLMASLGSIMMVVLLVHRETGSIAISAQQQ